MSRQVTLHEITRTLATVLQLLPYKPRCRHVWNDERCDPPACEVCGRRGFPVPPHEPHDVFDH